MSVLIGSKLETQPLQRCFLPLPEVSAGWSWRPIQTPLTVRSSFLSGQCIDHKTDISNNNNRNAWKYVKYMYIFIYMYIFYLHQQWTYNDVLMCLLWSHSTFAAPSRASSVSCAAFFFLSVLGVFFSENKSELYLGHRVFFLIKKQQQNKNKQKTRQNNKTSHWEILGKNRYVTQNVKTHSKLVILRETQIV